MHTPHTCTLYHRTVSTSGESWTRTVIEGVLWEDRRAANVVRSGLLEADRAAVYIPLTRAPAAIAPGDVLVKGAVTQTIGAGYTLSQLRAAYTTIQVTSVDRMDYGSPAMQHLQIGGS